jgi:hypothetical protein
MMFFNSKEKSVNTFAKYLVQLDAPTLIGLTRLLGVKIFYDDVKDENGHPMPKSGEAILEDCLVKFYSLNREKRKEILKITKAAAKEK